MEKKEFEALHYYLKWLGALPVAAVAVLAEMLISRYIQSGGIGIYIVCFIIMAVLMCLYYRLSDKLGLFRFKGYYAENDGVITVGLGNKTHEIGDINVLLNGEIKLFTCRYPYLTLERPEGNIKIIGRPLGRKEKFADTELCALSQLILERHDELKPRMVMKAAAEGWYEKSD